jgi:hypothetical protein
LVCWINDGFEFCGKDILVVKNEIQLRRGSLMENNITYIYSYTSLSRIVEMQAIISDYFCKFIKLLEVSLAKDKATNSHLSREGIVVNVM